MVDRSGYVTAVGESEIQKTLDYLFGPGHVVELRVPKTESGTIYGFFNDTNKLAAAASRLSGQAPGVYVTMNPVDPILLARANNRIRSYAKSGDCANDENILSRKFLLIDFDAKRPAGISSTDDEHEAAILRAKQCRQWLIERGWAASLLADSGNGAHLVARINLPNDEVSKNLLAQCLKALGSRFDDEYVTVDPTTCNASRIWKVYGTEVRKGDDMSDRPYRMASIIDAPERLEIVPVELLHEVAAQAPTSVRPTPRAKTMRSSDVAHGRGDYATLDVESWFQSHACAGRDLGGGKHSVLCPWVDQHSDPRAAEDSDTVIWEATDGRWPAFHCSHAHCDGRSMTDVIQLWGDADRFCSREFRSDANGYHPTADAPLDGMSDEAKDNRGSLIWHTAVEVGQITPENVEWCVEGMVVSGAITEISAGVKVGKTTLIGCLVKAALTGTPFLARPTRKTSVVWLTEERGPTFRNMLARVGLLEQLGLHIVFRRETRGMRWPDVVAEALTKAHITGSGMLVIDTLSGWTRLAGEEENSSGAAMESMEPVHDAAAVGLGVILSRHDRKGGGSLGESGRGSSAYAGEADILFRLARATNPANASRRTLSGTGRFDGIPEEQIIEFRDGLYGYLGDAPDIERRETKAWLLDNLPDALGTPLMKSEIKERMEQTGKKVSNSTLDRTLKELLDEGKVDKRKGFGTNKRALGYWMIALATRDEELDDLTTKGSTPGEVDVSDPQRDPHPGADLTTPGPPDDINSGARQNEVDGLNLRPTTGDDLFRGQYLSGEVDSGADEMEEGEA